MIPSGLHILLLANKDCPASGVYQALLAANGNTCDIINDPGQIAEAQPHQQYNGILYDTASYFHLKPEGKTQIKEYARIFPTGRISCSLSTGRIIVTILSNFEEQDSTTLATFLTECKQFPGRCLRRFPRMSVFCNVVIGGQRTNTTNLSKRGCFAFTVNGKSFEVGQKVPIIINELENKTPITSIVRRKVEWGSHHLAAGIGLEFQDINEQQIHEISQILSLK